MPGARARSQNLLQFKYLNSFIYMQVFMSVNLDNHGSESFDTKGTLKDPMASDPRVLGMG